MNHQDESWWYADEEFEEYPIGPGLIRGEIKKKKYAKHSTTSANPERKDERNRHGCLFDSYDRSAYERICS